MFRSFSVEEARQGILMRVPPDEMPVPADVSESIQRIFHAPLTPLQAVMEVVADVRKRGDDALREWTIRIDSIDLQSFAVPQDVLQAALSLISDTQRAALELAAERIRRFHQTQPVTSWMTQALGGTLGQLVRPIRRVGIYVPGGSAALVSTLLMCAIPAQVAGVSEIVLVSPPRRASGEIEPIILAAAAMLGIGEVYAVGGAQAVAALAYGTASLRRVDKIVGAGSLFVNLAKQQVYGVVGLDNLSGPNETVIIADAAANPGWAAADLLAQLEHDPLASGILFSPSAELISAVQSEIEKRVVSLPRAEIIRSALQNRSGAVQTRDLEEAVQLANELAPEHVSLSVSDPWRLVERITAAGAVFVGEHSFEVLGDYIAGPGSVTPTGGGARFASPLNVLDFVHLVNLVALDPNTTRWIAPAAAVLAEAEGLDAHAAAARARL